MKVLRAVRFGYALFILLYAVAVTYPGVLPFNHMRPLVLGLPFSFFWIALWVVLGLIVLLITDLIETQSRRNAEPR